MSETYSVKGNVEWLFEGAWVDLMKNDFDAKDFWPDTDVNIRRARDTSASRNMPAIAIEATVQQTIPNTNEYRCTTRFFCETDVYKTDKTGEQVKALIGYVRDLIHDDKIISRLNAQMRGLVMNSADSLHEVSVEDDSVFDDPSQIRRMILQADAWVYVGSEK
jgi:hypothetical protein